MFCKNCGTQMADDAAFCPNCGARNGAQPVVPQQQMQPVAAKRPNGKLIGIIAGGVAALAVIIVACVLIFGGSGASSKPFDALTDGLVKTLKSDGFDISVRANTGEKIKLNGSIALNHKKKTASFEVTYSEDGDKETIRCYENNINEDEDYGWFDGSEEIENYFDQIDKIVDNSGDTEDLFDAVDDAADGNLSDEFGGKKAAKLVSELYDSINDSKWLKDNLDNYETKSVSGGTQYTLTIQSFDFMMDLADIICEPLDIEEDDIQDMIDDLNDYDFSFTISFTIQKGKLTGVTLDADIPYRGNMTIEVELTNVGNPSVDVKTLKKDYEKAEVSRAD